MEKRSEIISYGKLETTIQNQTKRVFENDVIEQINSTVNRLFSTNPKIITSDVFDTILLRSNKSELRRFYEVSDRVAKALTQDHGKAVTREDIFVLRRLATKISYGVSNKVNGCREGSIDEIYSHMAKMLGLNATLGETLKQIELDYEIEQLELNSSFWKFLTEKSKEGVKIVLVSDMYLLRKDIIALCKSKVDDFDKVVLELISSADMKISKASGHIFQYIKKKYSAKGSEIIHFGDSLDGDYKKAHMMGIKAVHLPLPDYHTDLVEQDEESITSKLEEENILIESI